jgi:hypothetical protein
MSDAAGPHRSPKSPLARYANYFEVGHNPYEFLLDFGQFRPEVEEVAVHTRIALGPVHAKMLARMLTRAVDRHEAENGAIPDAADAAVDPVGFILRSLPDFEHRAVDARRHAAAPSFPTPSREPRQKGK